MATERKEPDVLIGSSGVTGVVGDIQADPDVKSGSWTAADPIRATGNNTNIEIHCSFPSPSGDLTVGAGLQEFRVLLRPFDSGQTGDPDWRIELWQGGTLVRAGSDTEILNDAGDTVVAFTWNANEITLIDGSDVEIKVFGTKSGGSPGKRNTIDIGAVEWNVDFTAGVNTATGSPSLQKITSTGVSKIIKKATDATATLNKITSTGVSKIIKKATDATATLNKITSTGVSKIVKKATGSAVLAKITSSGASKKTVEATDATATLNKVTSTGIANVGGTNSASGSPSLQKVTSTGISEVQKKASGSPTLQKITTTGASKIVKKASGSPTLAGVTSSGNIGLTEKAIGGPTFAKITSSGSANLGAVLASAGKDGMRIGIGIGI